MNSDYLALIIVLLLTLNLIVVGAYIILVLKEVRHTIVKINQKVRVKVLEVDKERKRIQLTLKNVE